MKKTNKVHPLTFFRESNEKRKAAYKKGGYAVPKNSLPKKQYGGATDPEYLAWKQQQEAAAKKKRDTEFTPGQQGKFMGSGITKIPYDLWQMGAKSPMSKYYKENPNSKYKYTYKDEEGTTLKAQNPNNKFGYFTEDEQKWMDAYGKQQDFEYSMPEKLQNMLPQEGYIEGQKRGGAVKRTYKKGGTVKKKMQAGGSSEQGTFRPYGAESKSKTSGSTYGVSPQAKRGGIMIKKKK
jgi:hypothetical protein